MKMIGNMSTISRLALLQCLVVVIAVLTTCGLLKLNAYDPDSEIRWNPVAVAIRNYGFLLLLVPAVWAAASFALERSAVHRWSPSWTLVSGLMVISLLVSLLWWTTSTPYLHQKVPLSTRDSQ